MNKSAMPHFETPDGMIVDFEVEKLGRDVLPEDYERKVMAIYGPSNMAAGDAGWQSARDFVARRVLDDMRSIHEALLMGDSPSPRAVGRLRTIARLKGTTSHVMANLWIGATCRFAQAGVRYVSINGAGDYFGEEDQPSQEVLDAAWRLSKESGINILRSKQLSMIAISTNNDVVGALWTQEGGYGDTYSFDVIVDPRWRRMGIGTQLAAAGNAIYAQDREAWPGGMKLDAVSEGGEGLAKGLGLDLIKKEQGHTLYAGRSRRTR